MTLDFLNSQFSAFVLAVSPVLNSSAAGLKPALPGSLFVESMPILPQLAERTARKPTSYTGSNRTRLRHLRRR